MSPKLINFQATNETAQNSTFILACIRERIEEFISWKIVKSEVINIDNKANNELYPGIKNAIKIDRNNIIIHNINLRDITFPIIFFVLDGLLEISLIVIV